MKSSLQPLVHALVAFTALTALPATAQSPAPPAASLGSTFFEWASLPVTPNRDGTRLSRNAFDGPTPTFDRLAMHITTLIPGASSHPHPQGHPNEEVLLVKEGALDVVLNGTVHRANAGAMIFLAPHVLHNFTNVGDKPATYYVMDPYTAATASVPERPADEWAPADKLHSEVVDCESIPRKAAKFGWRTFVVNSPTVTLAAFESHLTTLGPGSSTDVSTDPADEIIIIKSGRVAVTIKGVTGRLAPGSFFFMASNDVHQVKNIGNTPATYQVFKFVSDRTPKLAS